METASRLVDFRPEHAQLLDMDETNPDHLINAYAGDISMFAGSNAMNGPAVSLLSGDGELLALGGCIPYHQGVGHVWMFATRHGRKQGRDLYYWSKISLAHFQKTLELHRMQTVVASKFEKAHKFIMGLGFMPESTLRHYGPQREHFVMYVRQ